MLGPTRMDNSFVVLPKQRPQSQVLPPLPQGGSPPLPDPSPSGKAMDESFVVVYKNESASGGNAGQVPTSDGGHDAPVPPNNSGFNATITVLKRAFEIATTQTQVNYESFLMKYLSFFSYEISFSSQSCYSWFSDSICINVVRTYI